MEGQTLDLPSAFLLWLGCRDRYSEEADVVQSSISDEDTETEEELERG